MSVDESIKSRSWAEVSLSALRHNAAVARQCSQAEIMAVVKADAYGHGSVAVAQALADQASCFGVANLQEALLLRQAGILHPIVLLSACLPEEEEAALRHGIQVCISSVGEAEAIQAAAARLGTQAHVHVALDTGMGRMGFIEEGWTPATVAQLLACKNITWEGLATHLPCPDEDDAFTRQQIAKFHQSVAMASEQGFSPQWVHAANSAGTLGYKETRDWCNLARPGLMLYGVDPLEGLPYGAPRPALQSVLTWKALVTVVRELPPHHGVSYGRTYITSAPTRVATLACGYADGYPRQLSGQSSRVLIRGQSCPLLGRVTMDQIMVDVTDLADPVQAGDEAVLLGSQGTENITALELAEKAHTITWHIYTGIGDRVRRVYLDT